jgi:hypothetical protein
MSEMIGCSCESIMPELIDSSGRKLHVRDDQLFWKKLNIRAD